MSKKEMRIMRINENWSIVEDTCSWNVQEITHGINKKTKMPGNAVDQTYHGTLLQACHYVLDSMPKSYSENHRDVRGLANEIIKSRKLIIKALIPEQGDRTGDDFGKTPITGHLAVKNSLNLTK
jgi:hypothetical protein